MTVHTFYLTELVLPEAECAVRDARERKKCHANLRLVETPQRNKMEKPLFCDIFHGRRGQVNVSSWMMWFPTVHLYPEMNIEVKSGNLYERLHVMLWVFVAFECCFGSSKQWFHCQSMCF